jgi:FkbM family methyltransferase
MKQADVWPAYHGRGGSYELDIFKLLDAISFQSGGSRADRPFDLMIDLGANHGYYTEKVVQRDFAKSYIMIEANPIIVEKSLKTRWYNSTWKKVWFEEQAHWQSDEQMPVFQVINQALSNHSDGVLDMCQTEPGMKENGAHCTVPIASVDSLIPSKLTSTLQEQFKDASSAFIKIDTEGMDELVIRGMRSLLEEQRGTYEDGSPRYLVNFFQFEYSPLLMSLAKEREGFHEYDLKTVTAFLESIGFESFLIGPRYLPLSNGSWHDDFRTFTEDPRNNDGKKDTYPDFAGVCGDWCGEIEGPSFTADIFAIRSSHPKIKEIKVALGACQESKDFDIKDPQYSHNDPQAYLQTPNDADHLKERFETEEAEGHVHKANAAEKKAEKKDKESEKELQKNETKNKHGEDSDPQNSDNLF